MNKTVKNRNAPFAERSLRNTLDFFKEAVFSEEAAGRTGLLQPVDPRIKIAIFILLILVINFVHDIAALIALYAACIVLAAFSRISVLFFIKRVWFFIPLFTLVIAAPAFFMGNKFSPVLFIVRVATSVSYAVLLILTTKHDGLIRSLRSLGAPSIFVQTLDMTYRYIFFFVKAFEEMHVGLKSRLVCGLAAGRARKWIASRIAYLFRRSVKMSEEVYMAMVARGYTGEIKKYGA